MNPITIDTNPGPSVGFILPDPYQISSDSGHASASYNTTEYGFDFVDDTPIVFPSINHANQLGQGTYGLVIEVKYRNKPVALKKYNDSVPRNNVINEAKTIHFLAHDNIIKLYAVYENTKNIGLLLELMAGGSLHQLIHNHRQIKYFADHAMSWASQSISAISHMHDKGYLHRDIKPSNMLLSDDFLTLKICDFGTAEKLRTTMTNNRGSAAYMSPEVFAAKKYNTKCDIYSFGISLWEILVRKFPYDDAEPLSVQWQVTMSNRRPEKIKKIPEPLMDLIERCWHKDPVERPEAKEIKEIIGIIMESCGNCRKPLWDLTTNNYAYASKLNQIIPVTISAPGGLDRFNDINNQHQLGFGDESVAPSGRSAPPRPPNPVLTHRRTDSGTSNGYPSTSNLPPYPCTPTTPAPYPEYPNMLPQPNYIGFNPSPGSSSGSGYTTPVRTGYTPPYQPQQPIFPNPAIQAPLPSENGNVSSGGDNSPTGTERHHKKSKNHGLRKLFTKH